MYIYNMYVYIYPYRNKRGTTVNFIYIYFFFKWQQFVFGLVCAYLYLGIKPFACLSHRKRKLKRRRRIGLRKGKTYRPKQT